MNVTFTPFWFELLVTVVKVLAIFGAGLTAVPFMVLWERKLGAYIQQRVGPDRVGPWGLLQTMVDGGKLLLKEDLVPSGAEHPLHMAAPFINLTAAILMLAVLPFGPAIQFQPSAFNFHLGGFSLTLPTYPGAGFSTSIGIADLSISVLFYMAVTGVAIYGIVLAGWASNSKYSLLGGIRATAQMISYELVVSLSLLGVLLIAGTLDLRQIAQGQAGGFWRWNCISQPVGFLLFMAAGFAEGNRLPFDLPEGEGELGGGYHTEYSSMKFSMFFMAEYVNMLIFSTILATLFLGGFNAPLPQLMLGAPGSLLYAIGGLVWIGAKIFVIVSFMIFIRFTWPRFRYDQLMNLGWKLMLPLALVNFMLTAGVLAFSGPSTGPAVAKASLGAIVALFVVGVFQVAAVDCFLTIRKKRRVAPSC
jgi:NADH-quinone oxidoreductase subunit H